MGGRGGELRDAGWAESLGVDNLILHEGEGGSFNTRRSALRLARCSKVPVIGSFSGSRLDSPSRPLTVPLLAPLIEVWAL